MEIVEWSIEDVWSPTWAIFIERWQPLVFSLPIVIGISIAAVFVGVIPIAIVGAINDPSAGAVVGFLIVLMMPFIMFGSFYLWAGMTRVALAVAEMNRRHFRKCGRR